MAARICKIWTRGFARKAKTKNADSLKSWNVYRQELKQLNSQFKREWVMKEKEKQEAASAQAVREQRLEKIEEERNLKANEMELSKMEKNREIMNLKLREQQELDRKKGAERRMQFDSMVQRKRMKEVERQKIESLEFVTPENIDEVITNALKNPVDYNFALKPSGHKLY